MGFLSAKQSRIGFALLLTLGVAACASKDPSELAFEEVPAEKLYAEGLRAMETGDSKEAKKKFEEIDRQHPYSSFARKSMLLTAYQNFRNGNYTETVTAAKRFIALYPGDEDVPYAYYLIGESYYRQIPDVTRDQEAAERAMGAMNELVQRYPDSEYSDDARRKVRITLDQLAGKEMQIGRYYQERREYIAAINRFKVVVSDFQNTRHIEEALMRLAESYLAMGIAHEAQTAIAVLGHNFPDSPWYKRGYNMLNEGGLQPQIQKGSWISNVFS
ncbi:outer membrane protein assembly factor BamD [Cohaesibacter sp. CAU 1516]|uniref:outer membrane protein assembly factor BamD n=1 Tax=Cohaesibacter sp. CAU 1516 TaxID=2576038 RepID=UPI0010FE370A|nr:outer membrane protein assembly factor BamD [Cohaesibacter sp. CAU 1516]TLP48449.1 outer membrane protein assembly factor BamD [Cohaesibacter sp. CAU 1516]